MYFNQKDEALEETGWKLVHGDVFRPPNHPALFTAFVGSGIQLICMFLIILGKLLLYMYAFSMYVYNENWPGLRKLDPSHFEIFKWDTLADSADVYE